MGEELKPCPFCGAANGKYDGVMAFHCHACGASGPDFMADEGDAIAAWNRRTPEQGTSVVRWVRYDGTEGTLPAVGEYVMYVVPKDEYLEISRRLPNEKWECTYKKPVHGDLWAYLPEPSKGESRDAAP